MSEFIVNQTTLLQEVSEYKNVFNTLRTQSSQIEKISQRLSLSGGSGSEVKNTLRKIAQQSENQADKIQKLHISLERILTLYKEAEEKIMDNGKDAGGLNAKAEKPATDNMPFDDDGQYGGDQGSPQYKYEELADLVRKYYPDFTDKEVEDYLKKLNSEGCGYVAMVNTVFSQFDGKEKEFEEKFGFPMYDENGELNYDALVTDFYSATDNHNQRKILWFKWDGVDNGEDKSATEGYGTTPTAREYRWEMYMKDHGIDADVRDVNVTPETYQEVAQKGDIVIQIQPCILYDENGKEVCNSKGGHAMTVTGVTDDGMFIVSSWGDKYYVKPDDKVYSDLIYQQVSY